MGISSEASGMEGVTQSPLSVSKVRGRSDRKVVESLRELHQFVSRGI